MLSSARASTTACLVSFFFCRLPFHYSIQVAKLYSKSCPRWVQLYMNSVVSCNIIPILRIHAFSGCLIGIALAAPFTVALLTVRRYKTLELSISISWTPISTQYQLHCQKRVELGSNKSVKAHSVERELFPLQSQTGSHTRLSLYDLGLWTCYCYSSP